MLKTLEEIYDEHPLIKIIIGTDANHFIGGCESNFLNFAPRQLMKSLPIKCARMFKCNSKKQDSNQRLGRITF